MSLGSRIRELRKKKGVSIKEVASQVYVDHTYMSKIENEHVIPSEEVLHRLADYFNYDKDEFILLANRIPDDVLEILQTSPKEAIDFLREHFGQKSHESE